MASELATGECSRAAKLTSTAVGHPEAVQLSQGAFLLSPPHAPASPSRLASLLCEAVRNWRAGRAARGARDSRRLCWTNTCVTSGQDCAGGGADECAGTWAAKVGAGRSTGLCALVHRIQHASAITTKRTVRGSRAGLEGAREESEGASLADMSGESREASRQRSRRRRAIFLTASALHERAVWIEGPR